MTRGGHPKDRSETKRKCIVSGEVCPNEKLIRFVVGPEAKIYPDLGHKLPGRGIWVTADRASIEKAVKKGLFSRGAKMKVSADDGLADQVESLVRHRLLQAVSMARKTGRAICGLEKVKAALVSGEADVLLQASDGSERGKSALRPPNGEDSRIEALSGDELGLAFGRDNVIHAAILSGGFTDRVLFEAGRLRALGKTV
ncbi:MAG: RNA-binding protein [Rhodobacteraceae bacterium]|nr:RNA-binding protein [Paracoccaceae bacterium]